MATLRDAVRVPSSVPFSTRGYAYAFVILANSFVILANSFVISAMPTAGYAYAFVISTCP